MMEKETNTSKSANTMVKMTTQQREELTAKYVEHMNKVGVDPLEMAENIIKRCEESKVNKCELGFSINNAKDAVNKPMIKREFSGIPCGIEDLDKDYLYGFKPGDFVLVAADSGLGKSTLTAYFSMSMSKAGYKVMVFNFEDSETNYEGRLQLLKNGNGFTDDDLKNLSYTHMKEMDKIVENPMDLSAIITKIHAQYGTDVFIIDMLNDLADLNLAGDQSTKLPNMLQTLAVKLNVTVMCTVRLRKPTGLTAASRAREFYCPDGGAIAGFNNTQFRATKILTLSNVPDSIDEFEEKTGFTGYKRLPFAIHVAKARDGNTTNSQDKACVCSWVKYNDGTRMQLSTKGVISYEF